MIVMTELEAVEGTAPTGSLAEDVASRLRGRLAERRIRQTEVMLATGWSKTTAYRKMNGKSALDVDELDNIWQAFGISPVFLITGRGDLPEPPVPPAGFEPAAFRSEDPCERPTVDQMADVIHLPAPSQSDWVDQLADAEVIPLTGWGS